MLAQLDKLRKGGLSPRWTVGKKPTPVRSLKAGGSKLQEKQHLAQPTPSRRRPESPRFAVLVKFSVTSRRLAVNEGGNAIERFQTAFGITFAFNRYNQAVLNSPPFENYVLSEEGRFDGTHN